MQKQMELRFRQHQEQKQVQHQSKKRRPRWPQSRSKPMRSTGRVQAAQTAVSDQRAQPWMLCGLQQIDAEAIGSGIEIRIWALSEDQSQSQRVSLQSQPRLRYRSFCCFAGLATGNKPSQPKLSAATTLQSRHGDWGLSRPETETHLHLAHAVCHRRTRHRHQMIKRQQQQRRQNCAQVATGRLFPGRENWQIHAEQRQQGRRQGQGQLQARGS